MKTCNECNQEFESKVAAATFCSTPCRKAFNNRRATRGAVMYDMIMEKRFNRSGEIGEADMRKFIDRLASEYRDLDAREGRGQSWTSPAAFIEANRCWLNYVHKTVVAIGRAASRKAA